MAERYYLGADGNGTRQRSEFRTAKSKIVAEVVGGYQFLFRGMEEPENMANIIAG